MHVLVIDDTKPLADSVSAILKLSGFDVDVAYDGPSALALAEVTSYELVLTDLSMHPMSGIETARRLRQLMPEASYVFMTGFTSEEDVNDAAAFSGRDVLLKPFTPSDLVAALEKCSHS